MRREWLWFRRRHELTQHQRWPEYVAEESLHLRYVMAGSAEWFDRSIASNSDEQSVITRSARCRRHGTQTEMLKDELQREGKRNSGSWARVDISVQMWILIAQSFGHKLLPGRILYRHEARIVIRWTLSYRLVGKWRNIAREGRISNRKRNWEECHGCLFRR